MENSIFNCLMMNLAGAGKQFLPQTDADAAGQGQNVFFALFSEKMNGIFGTMLPQSMNEASCEPCESEEKGDASGEGPQGSSDHSPIAFFISSLLAAIDQQTTQSLPEEADLPAITEFLDNILEILSGGDEIELKGNAVNTAGTGTSEKETRHNGVDQAAASSFMGSLAVFLAAFNKMARQDTDAGSLPDTGDPAESSPGRKNNASPGWKMNTMPPELLMADVRSDTGSEGRTPGRTVRNPCVPRAGHQIGEREQDRRYLNE